MRYKMTFGELRAGDTFKQIENVNLVNTVYKKIDSVEDKWGNVFNAVSDVGYVFSLADDLEVIFVKNTGVF
jgi:hypothetical protein